MSLKANELRIGNYIYDDENVIVKVERIESDFFNEWNGSGDATVLFSINGDMRQSDVIKPIPLTEEILLKCGFEYNREKTYLLNKCCGLKLMDIVGLYYRANFPIKTDIKHLHQLQNLYFALTGEELEINL